MSPYLHFLQQAIAEKNLMNISTSNVMELYEYKLSAMGHAERSATASMEAAAERCTHLQHRTAQLTAELSRLHQLLFHTQQSHEQAVKNCDSLVENNKMLESKLQVEKGKYKACASQLKNKEQAVEELQLNLEDMSKKVKDLTAVKSSLEEQNNDLKKVVEKLEDNLIRKEKLVDRKNEELNKANAVIETLKSVSSLHISTV